MNYRRTIPNGRYATDTSGLPMAAMRRMIPQPNGCWQWVGYVNDDGYGITTTNKGRIRTHRFVYETLVGPIPSGLDIDHLCRNRACCNPDHLEPVTRKENLRRSPLVRNNGRLNALKTECVHGHAFNAANTVTDAKGWRSCRVCRNERGRARRRLLAAGAVVASTFAFAGSASAHATLIACTAPGTWTLTNDQADWVEDYTTDQGHAGTIPAGGSVDVAYDGTELTVYGYWPKGPGPDDDVTNTSTGTGNCVKTDPTTTTVAETTTTEAPTTTVAETTTTTTEQETTSSTTSPPSTTSTSASPTTTASTSTSTTATSSPTSTVPTSPTSSPPTFVPPTTGSQPSSTTPMLATPTTTSLQPGTPTSTPTPCTPASTSTNPSLESPDQPTSPPCETPSNLPTELPVTGVGSFLLWTAAGLVALGVIVGLLARRNQ